MFYNDAYRPMLGETKHPQFLGGAGKACWAEIWDTIGPMMDQVIATGEATWSENLMLLMLRNDYLEECYFTFSYSPIRDETGQPFGIFNACAESTRHVIGDRRLKTLRELSVSAATVDQAAQLCADILARERRDVPFVLVYLLEPSGQELRLAGSAGLGPGTPASPLRVAMTWDGTPGWPVAEVTATGNEALVEDLATRFHDLPAEPWGQPSHQAMVLPIPRFGSDLPAGALVLGISPRRAFDDDYRGFVTLAAGHIATAVANAWAQEEERNRAEGLARMNRQIQETNQELTRLNEKMQELDRLKSQFFANVSHELRTPLALILGPAEQLLGSGHLGPQDRRSLERIRDNARLLLMHVNDLLDAAKLDLFSAMVSHDLRSPLNVIHGYAEILLETCSARLDEEGRQYMGRICGTTLRMAKLIEDLLSYSRFGRRPLNTERIDMAELVRSVVPELQVMEPGRAIKFRIGHLHPVRGDLTLLRQVWVNLLGNAVNYTRRRQTAIIAVDSREEGDEIQFSVTDNGAGFDMAQFEKLFNAFQRLHQATEFEGTGLGLALVQRVVHRHGGRVWAEGKVDEGATFRFALPLDAEVQITGSKRP
jgi:signal transduction histidine kinase